MNRLLQTWLAIGFVGTCALLAGCNLSDPVNGIRTDGCVDDGDCEDHGACSVQAGVGTCVCNAGYTGSSCGECEGGFVEDDDGQCAVETVNNTNNATTNNTVVSCDSGEVMLDDQCVANTCAPNPCGDGTCTVTGDGIWECACLDGSTGTDCPGCADDCVNGTCDALDVCVCRTGWAGASCEMCAVGFTGASCNTCANNAFGPNCETCASLTAPEPWWDRAYAGRQGLIVYNPMSAASNVLSGVVVSHTFAHDMLVSNGGADPNGIDLRVVSPPSVDLDRILAVDSAWNQPDTTIWFPTTGDISPGGFTLVFLYSRNLQPATPLDNAANVLRQDRGWFHEGGPIYSAEAMSAGQYSIQLRQKSPGTMEVVFQDSGSDVTAVGRIQFIELPGGAVLQELNYGSSAGSPAAPADLRTEVINLPNDVQVDFLFDAGTGTVNESAAIFLGEQQVASGTSSLIHRATLRRAVNPTSAPMVLACPTETVPP